MFARSRGLVALGMWLALALPARVQAEDAAARLYGKALDSSGWVIGKGSAGAGCLVDGPNRLMVTNYHVVKDQDQVSVAFPVFVGDMLVADRDFYWKNWKILSVSAKVIFRDETRDLALIQVDSLPRTASPVTFAEKLPKVGERIYRVGSPSADQECWLQTEGNVRELKKVDLTYPSKQHVAATAVVSELPGTNGHSGAAVLNERGELVAIHAAKENARSLSVSIDVNEVRAFLTAGRERLVVNR